MQTHLQILSEEERHQVHERSLQVLSKTGVRVDTQLGRRILGDAGASVEKNSHIVRFPIDFIQEAIEQAPKKFSLGARRPEWDLEMNSGECSLLPDGEAVDVIDRKTGKQRPCNRNDWLEATRLTDALDEIGLYWSMVQSGRGSGSLPELVAYWVDTFRNFSKHVQFALHDPTTCTWLLEVLQIVFGDRETIKKHHPISLLLCPQSPLVIDQHYTDAYLKLLGWDIPVACMPMPLMGGTAPGNMISTIIQGNCECLALLCLIQAGSPGTPFIYAPALATMNPRTGLYSGGAIENGLMGAAATEMARYYGLPVESSGGGTDHFQPGMQAAYERALNASIPVLSWPDILVGPGLVGNSMILSLEQLLIDVEIFKMSAHAHRGIQTTKSLWLNELISDIGPGGNYLSEPTTVDALRSGEWFIQDLGVHSPQNTWLADGSTSLVEEACEMVDEILANHIPLTLNAEVEDGLSNLIEEVTTKSTVS